MRISGREKAQSAVPETIKYESEHGIPPDLCWVEVVELAAPLRGRR